MLGGEGGEGEETRDIHARLSVPHALLSTKHPPLLRACPGQLDALGVDFLVGERHSHSPGFGPAAFPAPRPLRLPALEVLRVGPLAPSHLIVALLAAAGGPALAMLRVAPLAGHAATAPLLSSRLPPPPSLALPPASSPVSRLRNVAHFNITALPAALLPPTVTALALSHGSGAADDGSVNEGGASVCSELRAVAAACPHLREVDLSFSKLNDEGLGHIFRSLSFSLVPGSVRVLRGMLPKLVPRRSSSRRTHV